MAMPMEEERPVMPPPPMNPEPPMDQPVPPPEGMDRPVPNSPQGSEQLRQELSQVIKDPRDLDRAATLMETDPDVRSLLRMLSENPNVKEFMMILGKAGGGQPMGGQPMPDAPPVAMEDRLSEARGEPAMSRPPMSGV